MLAVIVGLLLIAAIAVGIVWMVAAPRLQQGEDLLTPDGRDAVLRAKRQAREQSAAAAGTTWNALVSLRGRSAKAWAPVSETLHDRLDQLEARVAGNADEQGELQDDVGAAPVVPAAGSSSVGRPRSMPADSGPIPVDRSAGSAGSEPQVIDLRSTDGNSTAPRRS